MITGIGIDIIEVKRVKKWLENSILLHRFFHPDEIAVIQSRGNGALHSLAARFAAKEAFGKALGTGLMDIELKDICVINDKKGMPELKLIGSALESFEKSGADRAHVSLSHEKENAIAFVLLEKQGGY